VCEDEKELLDGIEKLLKFKINSSVITGFEADMKLDQRGELHRGQVREAYPGEATQAGQKKPAASHPAKAGKSNPPFPLDGGQPSSDRADLKSYRGRPGTSGGKRKGVEDPLFTQPYTPSSTNSPTPPIPPAADSHLHYQRPGRQNKPLAALFRPRPPDKPKQDGS
jgi:ATP-dependent RNA helicase RhlE